MRILFGRKRNLGFLALALIFASVVMSAVALAKDSDPKIVFGTNWFAQAEHGGFFQAVATGLYKKHGLDVTIRQGGPQVNGIQLLLAGKIDFYMGYPLQTIKLVGQGIPIVVVAAPFQKSPQVIICHSSVKSLAQAKGHPILVDQSESAQTFWPWLERHYGYTQSMRRPYTFNEAPFMHDPKTCQQGFLGAEPYTIQKAGGHPNVFLLAAHGYPPYAQVIVTRESMIKKHPQWVKEFVAASLEGWKSYLANPAPGNKLIKQYNPKETDGELAYGIKTMRDNKMLTGGDAAKYGIGTMTNQRWKKIFDFMVKANLTPKNTPYKKAYTLRFAPHPASE